MIRQHIDQRKYFQLCETNYKIAIVRLVAEQNLNLLKIYIEVKTNNKLYSGLCKYFKIRSSYTENSPKFPLGDLYMHNNINEVITNVNLNCTFFNNFFNTILR